MLKEKKNVWRRQVFLPQCKISSFQAVQHIGTSQSARIRSLRASTLFMLCRETVISFVCQIFSPYLLAKIVCCVGTSFLAPEKAFNLLLPTRWGARDLPMLCPPASPRRASILPPTWAAANPHPNKLAAARVRSRSHLFSHSSSGLFSHIWFPFSGSFYSLSLFQPLSCLSHLFSINYLNLLYL